MTDLARSLRALICVVLPTAVAIGSATAADRDTGDGSLEQHDHVGALPVWVESLPPVTATQRSDGSAVQYQSSAVWKPICGSDTAQITVEDLKRNAREMREALAANEGQLIVVDQGGQRAGLDIIFNVIPAGGVWQAPPAGAIAAMAEVEAYIESQFTDTVTMPIDIGFRSLGPNVLGSTSSSFINGVSWSTARSALVSDMDDNDLIQAFLPASTIPVYLNASSSTVSQLTAVNFTRANYNATVGTVGGSAATIAISTDFSFDYDPSNGVGVFDTCFESVLAHEVGHMLGFVSRADAPINSSMHSLDLFRFQWTDGVGNRNPDDFFDFFLDPRTVDYNNPPNEDAATDVIIDAYRMSDGDPNQASHFQDQTPQVCIMDPTIRSGITFAPNFYFDCDLVAFDAIGWDRSGTLEPPLPAPYPHDRPKNRYISFSPNPANAGLDVAYAVYIVDMQAGSCDGSGGRCRLDLGTSDCNICSISADPCISAAVDCPTGQTCLPTGQSCVNDLFNSNFGLGGLVWWVGEPDGNGYAHLVSHEHRYFSDNWPSVIQIGDCEIVPRATYSIQTYDRTDLSVDSLVVNTTGKPSPNYWGDCVGPFDFYCDGDSRNATCDPANNNCPGAQPCEGAYPPPDLFTNFDDVGAAVAKFVSLPGAALPDITWVDVHGDDAGSAAVDPPNLVANFADIDFIVKAFQGRPYPFADPANCPDVP